MGVLQMTWQPSLLKSDKRKPGVPPLGLRNLGNSCYLNSVLQCLTYTPPLANFCLRFLHSSICDLGAAKEKRGDCPFCLLEKRINRSLSIEGSSDAPLKINSCLRIYAEHFRPGRQEDAHEFLRYVIDACHNTCLRLKKLQLQHWAKNGTNGVDVNGSGETVVKEIFGGSLQSQVKCLSCGSESNKVDEIMDLSLDILHSGSLKDALHKFFQPEILDGNNKYKCDNCKQLVAAKKQMSIFEAPNVFVIQLKRFEGIFGGKVDKLISFEEILLLSSFMCKESQDQHPEYNLFATIVHSGYSSDSGHYYAYIKDTTGCWYCCNDSFVSVSSMHEVLSEKVYILFFSRTKQRKRSKVGLMVNGSKSCDSKESKSSTIQKSNGVQTSALAKKVPNLMSGSNNGTNLVTTNGSKLFSIQGSEKPSFTNHTSSNQLKSNNPPIALGNNGVKVSTIHKSDTFEASASKNGSKYDTEKNISVTSLRNSDDSMDLGNKHSCNHHTQLSNSTKSSINQGKYNSSKMFDASGGTKRLLATGNIKIAVRKHEIVEKSDNASPFTGKLKTKPPMIETNGMCEAGGVKNLMNGHTSLEICHGQNHCSVVSSLEGSFFQDIGPKTKLESPARVELQDLQSGSSVASTNNCSMKRKMENKISCVLLETDDQSRSEVEDFKEILRKEASSILRSCGWSDELYSFMNANKKLCLKDGNGGGLNDNENKTLLISHAKQNFISKVPESLKGRLIERLVSFSEGKRLESK